MSEELRELYRGRLEHLVPVREPLVLISQVQRSGGTLLSQLFDGHPECHAHPHELSMAYLNKPGGTRLDLTSAERAFQALAEKRTAKYLRTGYRKPAARPADADADVFPFILLPGLQRAIFERCFGPGIARDRDAFDCYFTSYFNAWLDNQNLYAGPKRVVTAFAPRLNRKPAALARLFETYPDGYLVSIVREPRAWYASARTQKKKLADVDEAMARWRRSAEAALAARESYRECVVVLTYEELVLETEETMERLAARIGISMSPALLEPTFNGRPIRANSSFSVDGHGVLADRTRAYERVLDAATIAKVDKLAGDLYDRARGAPSLH